MVSSQTRDHKSKAYDDDKDNDIPNTTDYDTTDRFKSSVVDVPDETNKTKGEHTVRCRPLDCITLYHCDVVSSTQVQLQTTQITISHITQLLNTASEYITKVVTDFSVKQKLNYLK